MLGLSEENPFPCDVKFCLYLFLFSGFLPKSVFSILYHLKEIRFCNCVQCLEHMSSLFYLNILQNREKHLTPKIRFNLELK